MPNAAAAAVGLERGAKAGITTPVSGDASGAEAVAMAWREIVLGEADIAICGGVETRIEAVPIAVFAQLHLLSMNNDDPAGACRPFDKDRDGLVFGEAGALMVIETEEHAKARGAKIFGRLMGAGITSDGYHIVAPDPGGNGPATRSSGRSSWPGRLQATSTTSTRTRPAPASVTWPRLMRSTTRWAPTGRRSTREGGAGLFDRRSRCGRVDSDAAGPARRRRPAHVEPA
jgi:beta-ketoacyl ACP synthase